MVLTDAMIEAARGRLLALRSGGGWGYRADAPPAVEPTALAALGLLAAGAGDAEGASAARASADWLAGLQGADGVLGVAAGRPTPGWATPYAILLWEALGVHRGSTDRAADWLLARAGVPGPARDGAVGHDATIPGWSWVDGTASWLEPTALAVLALRQAGRGDHPRTREGRRLILDRALPAGGWNYGNTTVFGTELRPQPGPTGLALLALAGPGGRPPAVERALRYLATELPTTRSALALGWGLMGLGAWGERPDGASAWLAECARRNLDRPDAAPRLAYVLLASSATTPSLLGLGPEVSS